VLIVTFGSSGDVHPFVGIGRALKARGHLVTLATNDYFQTMVERAGLGFYGIGTREEFLEVTVHPDLWHPLKGARFIASRCMAPTLGPTFDFIRDHNQPGQTVVLANTLAIGAACAHEKLGVPYATAHLSPAIFRSMTHAPVLPKLPYLPKFPSWAVRVIYWLADHMVIDPVLRPVYNAFRKELGLPARRGLFRDEIHSPLLTLGLFPKWFCAPAPDWPAQARVTGFPLYDGVDSEPDSQDLTEYLARGEPPVIFTAGSAMRQGESFFRHAVDAAGLLGRRAIMLTRFPEQLPRNLPANVSHFHYLPFSRVLPNAAALVHHGGVGSTAQALHAGCPQLIVHFSHDQPDNAARVQKLGAGSGISESSFTGKRAARLLAAMLEDASVRDRAQAVSRLCHPQAWMNETCDLIEGI
jgi:UDP:flavonoid glycosyltransferase YjiC (YdhE family)